ncbi:hypothetical protein [Streptomyces sp. HPF1205]|uniref:hypothetical protein n=1 Tax=Streptomyces sp. HPF1205 TaxID=2873262 RepID=UPI001CEDD270|nr:hypothetical protein [Streptomyces sp. HPF1205]
MDLFEGSNARLRVAVSGALCLARIMPIVEVLRTPFVADLGIIIAACGSEGDSLGAAVESLRNWRSELHSSNDILLPDYYRATALAVGLLIAAPDGLEPREQFGKINSNIGNFWNCCDHIVHRSGGFRAPELRVIKSTLRGVENNWFDRDIELISESPDPRRVLQVRLSDIAEKVEMRRVMAREFVVCAKWDELM